MSKTVVSILVWVVGWVGAFTVLEVAALVWPGCPWYTLSRTSWHIERAWWPFQFVFLFGLVVLAVHVFTGGVIQLAVVAPRRFVAALRGGPR